MASTLTISPETALKPVETVIIGRKASLTSSTINTVLGLDSESAALVPIDHMLNDINGSGKATTFLQDGAKLTIIVLPAPEKISRNNHPFSPHSISDSLSGIKADTDSIQIHVIDEEIEKFMGAASIAIARSLPLYNSKSKIKECGEDKNAGVSISFSNHEGKAVSSDQLWASSSAVADAVRKAARWGDMPPAELNPDTYSQECKKIADALIEGGADLTFQEILGDDLKEQGYGGIYGVGMCALCPPRMIVMTYTPLNGDDKNIEHIALCGKGVIYDTGGLSLKPKTGMGGMKHDMGGSAGVLGGFEAAVKLQVPKKITLILAIVENAIGPAAVRNDDILTMKSGKTVEINNTDAEGRLILADCVSYASNSIGDVDLILDMATLTGAQLVTTGKKHAGILAKTAAMEQRISEAGMKSGDLVYPMLYAPELLNSEFSSKVADMKNSVKDRSNAQASCAGHFIESHIDAAYKGDWVRRSCVQIIFETVLLVLLYLFRFMYKSLLIEFVY